MSAEEIDEPDGPRSVLRPSDRARTALGVFGGPVAAWVDQGGAVQLAGRRWCLDWAVHAEDRWYHPASEPSVRQRRIGVGPIVQTAIRAPGGDVEYRVWASQQRGGPVLAVEIENPTATPVGIALAVRPYDLDGQPSEVDADVAREGISVADPVGEVTIHTSVTIRDSIHRTAIMPLPHRSTIRVAVAPAAMVLQPVGDSASARRAWDTLLSRHGRLILPEDGLTRAFDVARARSTLGAAGLVDRVAAVGPGAGDELAGLALGGFGSQVRQVTAGLVGRDWVPDLRDVRPGDAAAALDGIAWSTGLHDGSCAEPLLEAGVLLVRSAARADDPATVVRAESALARLALIAGQTGTAETIDDRVGLGHEPVLGRTELTTVLERAADTGAWDHDDPQVAARVLGVIRLAAVTERWEHGRPVLDVFSDWPAAWRGGPAELDQVPTVFGRLSLALRWHGYRPALLWELDAGDERWGPVRLRCPGLDPAWSTTEPTGETLLAGTVEDLGPPPGEGMSFT